MVASVGEILFLTALALVVTILHTFLKQAGRDEYAYMTLVVGMAIGLYRIIPTILMLFERVEQVFNLY